MRGDAEFVVEQLSDNEFSGACSELGGLQIERGTVSVRTEDIQADEAMGLWKAGACGFHPGDSFRRMAYDDVGIVLPEPGFEAGTGDLLKP